MKRTILKMNGLEKDNSGEGELQRTIPNMKHMRRKIPKMQILAKDNSEKDKNEKGRIGKGESGKDNYEKEHLEMKNRTTINLKVTSSRRKKHLEKGTSGNGQFWKKKI